MQFATLILASLASIAMAQTSTSSAVGSTYTCAAQNILDACVSLTKGQVNSCQSTDYDCLCTAYGVVLTCYNNCPGDAGVFGVQQYRDQFCAAASAYPTKTTSRAAAVSTAATTSASVLSTTGSSTVSATARATGNAATNVQVKGGMMAVALVGLGLLT